MASATKTKSTYEVLSSINVRDKVERKGQMDYLSWANAWDILKQNYPDATRTVYEDQATGWNYFTDGRSAWVKVGITVNGMEHIDYLPIMDFRNRAIAIDSVTAMDVNKTIQRSTAKAIAMHGLGLSLWTGEDVPELTAQAPVKQTKLIELEIGSENWENVLNFIKANEKLGLEKLSEQIGRKYNITPAVKKEMSNALKSK